jgi:hypothetical protein
MSIARLIAATLATLLLALAPAAIAAGPPTDPGHAHKPASTPATPAAAKANAYGKLCQGESKKHVAGTKGTPFSRCVTAMAKAASGAAKTAREACAGLSRKHVRGQHGTPFSRCVAAASKLVARPAGA